MYKAGRYGLIIKTQKEPTCGHTTDLRKKQTNLASTINVMEQKKYF